MLKTEPSAAAVCTLVGGTPCMVHYYINSRTCLLSYLSPSLRTSPAPLDSPDSNPGSFPPNPSRWGRAVTQATIPVATPTAMRNHEAAGRWCKGWNMYTCPSGPCGRWGGVGWGGGLRGRRGGGGGRGAAQTIPGLTEATLKEQDAAIYPRNRTAHRLRNRLYFTYLQNLR